MPLRRSRRPRHLIEIPRHFLDGDHHCSVSRNHSADRELTTQRAGRSSSITIATTLYKTIKWMAER
jgi:hypothetical protein